MTTFFVCRHSGAIDWIKEKLIHVDRFVDHLDIDTVNEGDIVIGVLPISLASQVCKKGATFVALAIDQTRNTRGQELSRDCLTKLNCHLQAFEVVESKTILTF